MGYGKARRFEALAGPPGRSAPPRFSWRMITVVKPEWGTKRSCPKCGTRFYDLGNDDPITCIACGNTFVHDPVLKSKQPLPFEEAKPKAKETAEDSDLDAEDLDIEEAEDAEGEDVDLGDDDDDLGSVATHGEDDEH
jgi:uncharacterized protein (TIGR02300 family)